MVNDYWVGVILAAIALITGATLLSLQFGWKAGVGIALLVLVS